jgi:hypothetical protein
MDHVKLTRISSGILMLTCASLLGCGTQNSRPSGESASPEVGCIQDAPMRGIDGWDVDADIDVEPNQGPFGIPVTIMLTFQRGGDQVAAIETWQAVQRTGGEFVRTEYDPFGYPLDPVQEGTDLWRTDGLFLTGLPAVIRYYALDSSGTRIALGDVDVNGGLTHVEEADDTGAPAAVEPCEADCD